MTTLLRIQSGGNLSSSATRQIGQLILDRLRAKHPEARVIERDLVRAPLPHLDASFVDAMFTRPDDDALRLSNQLIAELQASDAVVIEAPMYNFTVPSTLKAWIDHVVRAKKTFEISATGARGLLPGTKAYLVLGYGGFYREGPFAAYDHLEPYLRAILGFIGLDVQVVRIDGLNMGREVEALAAARESALAMTG